MNIRNNRQNQVTEWPSSLSKIRRLIGNDLCELIDSRAFALAILLPCMCVYWNSIHAFLRYFFLTIGINNAIWFSNQLSKYFRCQLVLYCNISWFPWCSTYHFINIMIKVGQISMNQMAGISSLISFSVPCRTILFYNIMKKSIYDPSVQAYVLRMNERRHCILPVTLKLSIHR